MTRGAGQAGAAYSWAADAMTRARRAGATVVERVERGEILERDDWTCYLCGVRTDPGLSAYDPTSPTVDHVVPLSKGGQHTRENLRCACLRCNSTKGDADPLPAPTPRLKAA